VRISVHAEPAREPTAAPTVKAPPVVPEPVPAPPVNKTPAAAPIPGVDVRPLLSTLIAAVKELDERRRETLNELQQAAVELSITIASQLVRRVIDAGQFGVRELVEDALQRLPVSGPVQVSLHPTDIQQLQPQLTAQAPHILSGREVRFRPDPTLERGSCRADLPEEGILSDLHLSLGDLHEELMEGLADAQLEHRRAPGTDRSMRRVPDRRETA
jgi:flagellar biosynthesis/type III secretory pathway protein FliH